jgi:hypothetical protein
MEANELHLSRRSIRWKSKTTNGDPCKYKVYELMGTGRKDRERTFLVQCLILTSEPGGYYDKDFRVCRVIHGKALLLSEEMHIAESWMMIGMAVEKLMEHEDNDK